MLDWVMPEEGIRTRTRRRWMVFILVLARGSSKGMLSSLSGAVLLYDE
jgi:hypothetical protein